MTSIYPSLIFADTLNLGETIKKLEQYCQGFHLDIMDFHFVQNLGLNIETINKIRKATQKKLHIHLMVEYPERYIPLLDLNPYDIVSVHIESPTEFRFEELLKFIQLRQLVPSVAINPTTPLEAVIGINFPFEQVLVMSVDPAFSNQKFLPNSLEKIKALDIFRKSHKLSFNISVDGGITNENIREIIKNGANEVAIASVIFGQGNPVDKIKALIETTKTI